jgi:transcriptional regulator with PAS, ATPase and Fis domain
MPLARAMRGESVDQLRMLIRNPAHPAGAVVSVSARPLDSQGAVAVFRDVTDRARAAAEMAAFTERLRHELEQRQTAESDLEAQKDYLTQILDTLDVTVVTCDVDGATVHTNRKARANAFPEEKPLTRALSGEEVDGVEAVLTLPTGDRGILEAGFVG